MIYTRWFGKLPEWLRIKLALAMPHCTLWGRDHLRCCFVFRPWAIIGVTHVQMLENYRHPNSRHTYKRLSA